tara:strand:- start:107 stop:328 length:222 start_codon:yes stop_codon:yes gene_type:complete
MKIKEVRELTEKERLEKISDLSQEYFNLKFQLATGKIEAPGRLRIIKRGIARLKTVDRESELMTSDKASAEKV